MQTKLLQLLALVIGVEIVDQLLQQCGSTLPFPFPFWDVLIAIGTVGVVFVTLQQNKEERDRKAKESVQQRIDFRDRLRGNLKNEILNNFDQLNYNGLTRYSFRLYLYQMEYLMQNSRNVNPKAEGTMRKLIRLYQSEEQLNNLIKDMKFKPESNEDWIKIKKDIIKNLLHILWVIDKVNFENEGERWMNAINGVIGGDGFSEEALDTLSSVTERNRHQFLKHKHNLDQAGFDHYSILQGTDFEDLKKRLLSDTIDWRIRKEIFENYVIEELVRLFKNGQDPEPLLEDRLAKLIN